MVERRVVHVVPRLGSGGPTTSLLYEGRWAARHRPNWTHELLVLEPGGSREAVLRALQDRIRVHAAPDGEREAQILGAADVVVLHYWNTPSMWRFLSRSHGTAWRWILYCHVNGGRPPQLLPDWLARAPSHLVLTSPHARTLRDDGQVSVVPALVDLETLPNPEPPSRTIVHVGTLTVFKLDARFVDLHSRAVASGASVEVVGDGGDRERFAALTGPEWTWHGFDPRPWDRLSGAAVFSAPIPRTATSSGEKTIQEAGLLGIPTVVYRDSPVAHLIHDHHSGLVAGDREEFTAMLTDALPTREAVRQVGWQLHDPRKKAAQLAGLYDEVAERDPQPMPDAGDLRSWVQWQTVGSMRPGSDQPSLERLAAGEPTLVAWQKLASEGGLAQYLNDFGGSALTLPER